MGRFNFFKKKVKDSNIDNKDLIEKKENNQQNFEDLKLANSDFDNDDSSSLSNLSFNEQEKSIHSIKIENDKNVENKMRDYILNEYDSLPKNADNNIDLVNEYKLNQNFSNEDNKFESNINNLSLKEEFNIDKNLNDQNSFVNDLSNQSNNFDNESNFSNVNKNINYEENQINKNLDIDNKTENSINNFSSTKETDTNAKLIDQNSFVNDLSNQSNDFKNGNSVLDVVDNIKYQENKDNQNLSNYDMLNIENGFENNINVSNNQSNDFQTEKKDLSIDENIQNQTNQNNRTLEDNDNDIIDFSDDYFSQKNDSTFKKTWNKDIDDMLLNKMNSKDDSFFDYLNQKKISQEKDISDFESDLNDEFNRFNFRKEIEIDLEKNDSLSKDILDKDKISFFEATSPTEKPKEFKGDINNINYLEGEELYREKLPSKVEKERKILEEKINREKIVLDEIFIPENDFNQNDNYRFDNVKNENIEDDPFNIEEVDDPLFFADIVQKSFSINKVKEDVNKINKTIPRYSDDKKSPFYNLTNEEFEDIVLKEDLVNEIKQKYENEIISDSKKQIEEEKNKIRQNNKDFNSELINLLKRDYKN